MKKLPVGAFAFAFAVTLSSQAQAYTLDTNLLSCQPASSGNEVNYCMVEKAVLAEAQDLESTFVVGYTFNCSPGPTNWLSIGVSSNGGPTAIFNFGQSGTVSVTGRGPVGIKDENAEKTRDLNFDSGCSLVVNSITIAPTEAAISDAISAKEDAAEGWEKVITITATNHAALVNAQDGAYCTLIDDYKKLSDVFGANGSLESIKKVGGEPARSLLAEAVQAASDNGAFTLSGDAYTYLENNLSTVLTHSSSCEDGTDHPISRVSQNFEPNIADCHNFALCKTKEPRNNNLPNSYLIFCLLASTISACLALTLSNGFDLSTQASRQS